jgi:hypothetical protein
MANLYRLKYIENGEIRLGGLAKLPLVLNRLEQLSKQGMYCIVIDSNGNEYQPPEPIAKPQAIATKYPSPKPMDLGAIAAHLNKPENVEKRRLARLDDANQWAKLRNS